MTVEQTTWGKYVALVRAVLAAPAADVTGDERLIDDLGLDSLSIIELALEITDTFDVPDEAIALETRDWSTTTVASLYSDCGLASHDPAS